MKSTISQLQAQKIMGRNFFGIENAIEHFGVEPTEEELKTLSEIPYSEKLLKECKDTHILVAIFPVSILTIREKVDSELFYDQTWYNDEKFAKERGSAYWKLIIKTPVLNSTLKNWKKQLKLIGENEEVLTARAMVYTIIGYYLKTGEKLFKRIWVRTFSTDSNGSRIDIGSFGSGGLRVENGWVDRLF